MSKQPAITIRLTPGSVLQLAVVMLFAVLANTGGNAAEDAATGKDVLRPFLKQHCLRCHGPEKQEADLRLDGPFHAELLADEQTREFWQSVWRMTASGQMPPKDEPRPSAQQMLPFLDLVRNQVEDAELRALNVNDGRLRRLTAREQHHIWLRALDLDLANVQLDLHGDLADDPAVEGFLNRGEQLPISNVQLGRSLRLAERLLNFAYPDPASEPKPHIWHVKGKALLGEEPVPPSGSTPAEPMHVHVSVNSQRNKRLILHPPWYDAWQQGPYRSHDHLVLSQSMPLRRGLLSVTVRARALATKGATPPTLAVDAIYRPRAGIALGAGRIVSDSHSVWPIGQAALPRSGMVELRFDMPLSLFDIDYDSIYGGQNQGLHLNFRNLTLPDEPAKTMSDEERKAFVALPLPAPESIHRIYHQESARYEGGGTRFLSAIEILGITVQIGDPDRAEQRLQRIRNGGPRADLESFAARAWGRRPTTGELAPFEQLRHDQTEQLGPLAADRVALAAILCAPDCLVLAEQGDASRHGAQQRARWLSLHLWGENPDEALLAAAASGKLDQQETLESELRRLIDDERFEWFCREFMRQWLHLDQVADVELLPQTYGMMDADLLRIHLKRDIPEEPVRLLLDGVRRNRPVTHLIAPDRQPLTPALARFYGATLPAQEAAQQQWTPVPIHTMPADRQAGLFSMAAPIAVASRGQDDSQIYRGVYLLTKLLGVEIGDPPAAVPALDEVAHKSPLKLSIREQLKLHRQTSCAVCHDRIDPLGFVWDAYHADGAVNVRKRQPDSAGKLPDGRPFATLSEMRDLLTAEPLSESSFHRSFVRAMATYVLGRRLTLSDDYLIDNLQENCNASLRELLVALLRERLLRDSLSKKETTR